MYRIGVLADGKQSGSATPSKLLGFVKRRGCFRRSCNMTTRNAFLKRRRKMLQPMPSLHFPEWQD